MLKITKQQMTVIDRAVDEAFVRRAIRYVMSEHAEAVADLHEDEIRRRVVAAIARARGYGMTWASSILAFLALMFEIAPSFDEQPAIRRVLKEARTPPNLRINALWERTTDQDWEEAAEQKAGAEDAWSAGANNA